MPHPDPIFSADGRVAGAVNILVDLTERKEAEAQLEELHSQLMTASRLAGMADVATGVLHNVGNVLNSVNVSAALIADKVRNSRGSSLARISGLLREHAEDLGAFLTADVKGRQVPGFLETLAERLCSDERAMQEELTQLTKNIEHIKDIVAMQQNYATFSGVTECMNPIELIEDALRISHASIERHGLELVREFAADLPLVRVDKPNVMQILINLLNNAKHACDATGRTDKRVTVRAVHETGRLLITIADNGTGIAPENLDRVFNHGFTTKKDGHGFGLHSGANAVKKMRGTLTVHSDGPGCGAAFMLDLPVEQPPQSL